MKSGSVPAPLLESSPHLAQLSSWKPSDLQPGFKELNQHGNQKQIRNCNKKQVIQIYISSISEILNLNIKIKLLEKFSHDIQLSKEINVSYSYVDCGG